MSMLEKAFPVRLIKGAHEFEKAFEVRRTVFIEEQKVPESIERDEHDASGDHVVAVDEGRIIGTGRLAIIHSFPRIGRMAVLQEYRGQGVGRAILLKLLEVAQAKKFPEVHLAAQLPVEEFYRKMGFGPYGEIFEEASILHRMMKRKLPS